MRNLLVLTLLAAVSSRHPAPAQELRFVALHFDITDSYGHPLNTFYLRLERGPDERIVDRDVRQEEVISVAPGEYRLTCRGLGLESRQQTLLVARDEKTQLVRFSLWVAALGDDQPDVRFTGRVAGLKNHHEPVWIRLIALFGELQREERVSRQGEFAFHGLKLGDYLAIVLQGDKLLHTQRVTPSPLPDPQVLRVRAGE